MTLFLLFVIFSIGFLFCLLGFHFLLSKRMFFWVHLLSFASFNLIFLLIVSALIIFRKLDYFYQSMQPRSPLVFYETLLEKPLPNQIKINYFKDAFIPIIDAEIVLKAQISNLEWERIYQQKNKKWIYVPCHLIRSADTVETDLFKGDSLFQYRQTESYVTGNYFYYQPQNNILLLRQVIN